MPAGASRAGVRLALRMWRPSGRAEVVAAVGLILTAVLIVLGAGVTADALGSMPHRAAILKARSPRTADHTAHDSRRYVAWTSVDVGGVDLALLRTTPGTGDVPPPPGTPAWPEPGEIYASPAAWRLLQTNPYARVLVPGHVVGVISGTALRDPQEAYIVVGQNRADLPFEELSGPIAGWGAVHYDDPVEYGTSWFMRLIVLCTGVLVVGSLSALTVAARAYGRARAHRLTVLRLLGAPQHITPRVVGTSTAVLTLLGGLAGVVAVPWVSRWCGSLGMESTQWWTGTTWSRATPLAVLAVVCALYAVRPSARATAAAPWDMRDDAEPRVRRVLRIPRGVPLGIACLLLIGAGLADRWGASTHQSLRTAESTALAGGFFLLLVGAAYGAPVVVRAATAWPLRSSHMIWRVAAARLRDHGRGTTRLIGALMVLILTIGLTMGLRSIALGAGDETASGSLTVLLPSYEYMPTEQMAEIVRVELRASRPLRVVVERKATSTRAAHLEEITSAGQVSSQDPAYGILEKKSAALELAATIARTDRGKSLVRVFDDDLTDFTVGMIGSSLMLLAQSWGVLLVLLALLLGLLAIQGERLAADMNLLMAGLSRRRLRGVRAAETLLAVLPGVAIALAGVAAISYLITQEVFPTLPLPTGMLVHVSAAALALCVVLPLMAALATPRLDARAVVREEEPPGTRPLPR